MDFIAIDPGKRSIAWALFKGSRLTRCGFTRHAGRDFGRGLRDMLYQVREDCGEYRSIKTVVEMPRIYPKGRDKDPNDIVDLAAVAGGCAILGPLQFIHPRRWKGNVPKDVQNKRVNKHLDEAELGVLTECIAPIPRSLQHNVLDAVGLGIWWRGQV